MLPSHFKVYLSSISVWLALFLFDKRDVHFEMSKALPSVNYISHEVNTCIRTIFQSYPITRHKIVLASSAMFDVIKNVMSSTVLEEKKKKRMPKLSKVHTGKVSVTFLEQQNILVLVHPLYSPNLASYVFWLLLLIKEKLAELGGNIPGFRTS